MHQIPRALWPEVQLGDDRTGRLIAPHLMRTGVGEWWADRWPHPRVSCLFLGGNLFVVTAPAFRGRGLSPRCAEAAIADIRARGKTPTWTTWPANASSLRVAEKLGFRRAYEDHAWIAGQPL
jgi:RimJ/RimL family protein N-acetyltransferase